MTQPKPVHAGSVFEKLKEEHRRALEAQDVEALQRVQKKLDKLSGATMNGAREQEVTVIKGRRFPDLPALQRDFLAEEELTSAPDGHSGDALRD